MANAPTIAEREDWAAELQGILACRMPISSGLFEKLELAWLDRTSCETCEWAREVVAAFRVEEPETWDVSDEEREEIEELDLEQLALERFAEARAHLDGCDFREFAAARVRCPKGTARGGRFMKPGQDCGGPNKTTLKSQLKEAAKKGDSKEVDRLKKALDEYDQKHGKPGKKKAVTSQADVEVEWETGPGAKPSGPRSLNGVAFKAVQGGFWNSTPDVDLDEPTPAKGQQIGRVAVLIKEPDGRLWLGKVTNGFGGRAHTLPGGTVERGLTLQQNALKEVWEETGLKVKITGYAGDVQDSNNGRIGRVYVAERVGGAPWAAPEGEISPGVPIINRATGKPAAENSHIVLAPPDKALGRLNRTDDKAQVYLATPIPKDAKYFGTGSEPFKKLVSALEARADQYHARNAYGDGFTAAVAKVRGFDAKPKVVSSSQFDADAGSGKFFQLTGGPMMLHAVSAAGGKTGKQLNEEFRSGEAFPSLGCFGNGTYFDSNRGANNVATQGKYGSDVIRAAISSDAKVINYSELEKLVPKPPTTYADNGTLFKRYPPRAKHMALLQWRGMHAALAGFDAIVQDKPGYGHGFVVVLNRGKVIVDKADYTPGYRL